MTEVKVVEGVAAPASRVWDLVRDFGGIEKWSGPGIEGCTLEGEGIGAIRTIRAAGGVEIRERLESFDDAARSFSYSIQPPSPLPVQDYLSTLRVLEDGEDACTIDWSSRFDTGGAPEAQAVGMVEGIYKGSIAAIRKHLGA